MEGEPEKESIYDVITRVGGFPLHCAHRGGCGVDFGPENTMYSYRKSVLYKTKLLEIDLRVTKDGHLVLMHDDDVDRTTDGTGDVSSLTLEEIKKLNAAKNFPELHDQNITVPTFQEFLDEFLPNPDLMFMLDYKDELSIELSMQIVKEKNFSHRVILGSVDQDCNKLLAKIKPESVPLITDASTTIAIATSYYTGFLNYYKIEHNIFGYILSTSTTMFWSKGLVDALHGAGMLVLVCGEELDKVEVQQQCIDFGVDYIMTDRPDTLTTTFAANKLMDY